MSARFGTPRALRSECTERASASADIVHISDDVTTIKFHAVYVLILNSTGVSPNQ